MQWFESRALKIGGVYGISALVAMFIVDLHDPASFAGDNRRFGITGTLEFVGALLPKTAIIHAQIVAHLGESVAISYAIFNGVLILLMLLALIAYGLLRRRDPETPKVNFEPTNIRRFVSYWKLIRGLMAAFGALSTYHLVIGTGLSATHRTTGGRGFLPIETIYGDNLLYAQAIWSTFAVVCWIAVADISKGIDVAMRGAASAPPVNPDTR